MLCSALREICRSKVEFVDATMFLYELKAGCQSIEVLFPKKQTKVKMLLTCRITFLSLQSYVWVFLFMTASAIALSGVNVESMRKAPGSEEEGQHTRWFPSSVQE